MSVLHVADAGDDRLADYRSLTDVALRRRLEPSTGLYMAEGAKVIARAIAAGHRPRSLLVSERWLDSVEPLVPADTPIYVAAAPMLESVTGYDVHRGALAAMHRPALASVADTVKEARLAVVLDGIVDRTNVGCSKISGVSSDVAGVKQRSRIAVLENLVDHTNVGACFRSAAAMGIDAVFVTPQCADPLYRRSIRVSMGTVFQVPWTRIENWPTSVQDLKDAGYVVAGMTLGEEAITLDKLVAEDHENLALVFGSEGHGLTPQTDHLLDRRVTIPMMHGVDSLNVAASSAVAFYATR